MAVISGFSFASNSGQTKHKLAFSAKQKILSALNLLATLWRFLKNNVGSAAAIEATTTWPDPKHSRAL
ncbi:MAG: hypothetical protein AB7T49_17720 [Oligoflexales bacterium]